MTKKEISRENQNMKKRLKDIRRDRQAENDKVLYICHPTMLKRKNIKKFIMVTVLLLILDVASKYFFYDLQMGRELALIDPSFNFGIARSIGLPLIITVIVSLLALVLFFIIYFRGYITIIIA